MAVGNEINPIYRNSKPKVIQITWHHALDFIHRRFSDFRACKTDHGCRPESGRILWDMSNANADRFEEKVLATFPSGGGATALEDISESQNSLRRGRKPR